MIVVVVMIAAVVVTVISVRAVMMLMMLMGMVVMKPLTLTVTTILADICVRPLRMSAMRQKPAIL